MKKKIATPKPFTLIEPVMKVWVICRPGKKKWIPMVATVAYTRKDAISIYEKLPQDKVMKYKSYAYLKKHRGWKALKVNLLISISK